MPWLIFYFNRPHPNECSGSDLDGDLYFVCWDRDLIPPRQVPPMDYNPAPTTQLDHDVTIEVMVFFWCTHHSSVIEFVSVKILIRV